MENDNSETFVSNASSRSKSFGHNKFQIQLQDANNKIEELDTSIHEKNTELELFKNNMRDFHLQLQTKNTEISQLKEEVNSYKNNLELLTFDFNKLQTNNQNDEVNLEKKHNILHDENLHLANTITLLNKTQNEMTEKYNDLKTKYQNTLELLEKKSNSHSTLLSTHNDNLNELNLLKELNLRQEKEIETIKQELFLSKNETSVLKTQLFEKDISLGQLHKKLALEKYTIRGKIIEQPTYTSPDTEQLLQTQEEQSLEPDNLNTNYSRPVKITTQRGVKLSKR
jgi:chromosome segregation ATPase